MPHGCDDTSSPAAHDSLYERSDDEAYTDSNGSIVSQGQVKSEATFTASVDYKGSRLAVMNSVDSRP